MFISHAGTAPPQSTCCVKVKLVLPAAPCTGCTRCMPRIIRARTYLEAMGFSAWSTARSMSTVPPLGSSRKATRVTVSRGFMGPTLRAVP
eukprot:scaffold86650_cov59-Phaeocystis_antarctica.AAC.2